MRRMRVDLPEPLAPRIPWMSPRSRRIDTSVIAATGLRFAADDERLADAVDEQGGHAPSRPPLDAAGMATGVVFSWSVRVVTSVLRWTPRLAVDGPGHGTSRGPRPTLRRVGLAARDAGPGLPGAAGKGIKKAGGPIWPTARGSSGRRSYRLRLARDGRRSPAITGRR